MKPQRLLFVLVCSLLFCAKAFAQDMHLSQLTVAPTYINPAFAGSIAHFRLVSHSKYQWAGTGKNLNAQTLSFDYNWDLYSSGFGLLLSQEGLIGSGLKNLMVGGQYAYHTQLTDGLAFKGGLHAGAINRRLDYGALVFPDQINGNGPTAENLAQGGAWYLDIGAGLLLYTSRFWVGGAAFHLGKDDKPAPIGSQWLNRFEHHIRYSAHAGGKIPIWERHEKEFSFYPTAYWTRQNTYNLWQTGVDMVYSPLVLGTWFRNAYFEQSGQKALGALAGFKLEKFDLRYSYEFTLGGGWGALGAVHELSLRWSPKFDDRYKGGGRYHKFIECPTN